MTGAGRCGRRLLVSLAIAAVVGPLVVPSAQAASVPISAAEAELPVVPGGPEPGAAVGSVLRVKWAPCATLPAGAPALECAAYQVPLDYEHPGRGKVTLALTRRKATGDADERIGSLFLNPGGPGGRGTVMPLFPFFSDLNERFDLIGFDPRGVGESKPNIACANSAWLEAQLNAAKGRPSLAAGPQRGLALGRAFDRTCIKAGGALQPYVGTEYVARDLDVLRAAVGDDKLSYLGFSYGTYLGTVYADLFPSRVRAVVLDGAVDPNAYGNEFLDLLRPNYQASEQALKRFLAWCQQSKCGFGGNNPRAALDALVRRLDSRPVKVHGKITNGYTVVYDIYTRLPAGRAEWPALAKDLALAAAGKPTVTNASIAAASAEHASNVTIECTDSAGGTTPEEFLANARRSWKLAPFFAPALISGPPSYDGANGGACAQWPRRTSPSDHVGDYRAQGSAAPILVLGNTGDPSTPYAGAVTLAKSFERGVLLTLVGEGHTSYRFSSCIQERTNAYLFERTLPAKGEDRCVETATPS